MKSWLLSISLLLLFFGVLVSSTWAVVDGSVEWNYVNFERDHKDGDNFSASSFSQRYSVLYSQSGLLGGGRLGSWTLGLGAEWAAFDSDVDGEEIDMDSFKILYNGDLLIAPGGLPFRLHAYSYDLDAITTTKDNVVGLSRSPYLRPWIATDLNNGQTIHTGVQFVAGIRNGSYLGKYREALSQWPRILLDYRDIYRRDIKAITPTKFRQRDLAFVSLNKKDNWFHYRIYDFKDYINTRNDTREETVLLGTIDHLLKRQWIHLTNWIQISVDGSYTTTKDQLSTSDESRYDVNLFSTMQWRDLKVANFSYFSRERTGSRVAQYLDVPIYLNNRISPDVNLRGQVVVNRWEEKIDSRLREKEDVYYSTAKYETNITRRIRVNYEVEAEYNTRKQGNAQGLRAEVEAYSNRVTRDRLSWYGNLGLGRFSGDALNDDDTGYWESFGTGRVTYSLTRSLRLEVSQELLYGSGSIGAYTTSYLVPRSTRGFDYTDGEVARDDNYLRTQTGLSLEHSGRNRLSNRVSALYKYEEDARESRWVFELEHRLRYDRKSFSVNMTNYLSTGDIQSNDTQGKSFLGSNQDVNSVDRLYRHRTHLNYLPNKYWLAEFDLDVEWRRGKTRGSSSNKNNSTILFTQKLRRNFYAINGVIRKLADIEQRIDYEKFMGGFDQEWMTYTLAGNYYPINFLSFGGRFEYRYYNPGQNIMLFSLSTGLHFPKFQVDFDYEYGTDDDRQIVVQRYEVNVRKTF